MQCCCCPASSWYSHHAAVSRQLEPVLSTAANRAYVSHFHMHALCCRECQTTSFCNVTAYEWDSECTPLLSAGSECNDNGNSASVLFSYPGFLSRSMLCAVPTCTHLHVAHCSAMRQDMHSKDLSSIPSALADLAATVNIGIGCPFTTCAEAAVHV